MNRKTIFETIRKLFGPLNQKQVDEIDTAIDSMIVGGNPKPPLTNNPSRTVSKQGIQLIHDFEGLARKLPDGRVAAYPDPGTGAEPWTIGWGSTGADPFNGGRIRKGTVWTLEQCNERFKQHLVQFESEVAAAIGNAPTSQNQFDALVSFHYNTGAIARSTLLQKHKNSDYAGAAKEFARWNKAGGQVMKGLVRRRKAEADMYLGV